jgi:nitrite reductase [NAD(P)H] small subunit
MTVNQGIMLGGVTQIPKGEGRTFVVAGQRVALFRMHSGEVYAAQADCPHLGGPLADGLTGGSTVICPLHERAYDLRTGQGLHGECASLRVYPVSLDTDGNIWLQVPE